MRVAYLLSRYPAISHTFFLHEVLGLRARGMQIQTASINPPDRSLASLPAAEAAEAAHTEYIKNANRLRSAGKLLRACAAHPLVLLRGLAAVARVPCLTLPQRLLWCFYLAEAMLVGQWMQYNRLKHLHVHFGGPVASVGLLTSLAWNVPFSLTIHGPEELQNIDANHLREKVEHAAFVFCISDFCRSQLCQLTAPGQWSKFQVMRLGVDPVLLTPAPRLAGSGTTSKPLELVCVGRLVAAKGYPILLEALRQLRDRGIHLHATLVGDGPERESLELFAAHHGLLQRITFTGSLSHEAALARVRRADILPSPASPKASPSR